MIIGETEVILENQELYAEDYDEFGLVGLFKKRTPEEKAQRKEEKHQSRLDSIRRQTEKRIARDADPNREARRQALFNDVGNIVTSALPSFLGGKGATRNDTLYNPSISTPHYISSQHPTDYTVGLTGMGTNFPPPPKKDNTMLWAVGILGGVIGLGMFAMYMKQNNSAK